MARSIFRSVLVAAMFSAWAPGQVESGAIVGTVIDPSGAPIAKAKVTVTHGGTKAKVTASTASDGSYAIRNLATGSYIVEIDAKGFKKSLSQNLQVGAGDGMRVDTQLEYTDIAVAGQAVKAMMETLEVAYQDGGRDRHEEYGIHACRPGNAMMDVDLSSDTLFCYHVSNDVSSEESRVDESTEREGLRACPAGWYLRGIRAPRAGANPPKRFPWSRPPVRNGQGPDGKSTGTQEIVLLCSRRPDVTPSGEWKSDGGCGGDWHDTQDLLQHPDEHNPSEYWPPAILTGINLCATTQPVPVGKVVFYHQCGDCHGTNGNAPVRITKGFRKITSRPLGSPEVQVMTDNDLQKIFTAKHGGMIRHVKFSKEEIQDLLSYIRTLKQ